MTKQKGFTQEFEDEAVRLVKKYGFVPDKLVTDDLRSYHAAARDLGIAIRHERGR